MIAIAQGLAREEAEHWRNVLADNGIDGNVVERSSGYSVEVDDEHQEAARALFASPFDDDEGEEAQRPAAPETPAFAPGERTELLAQTSNVLAAQQLTAMLRERGVAAFMHDAVTSSMFGSSGLPEVTVHVASRQQEQAFAALEEIASHLPNTFAGGQDVDPREVLEAMLLAPTGRIRIRAKP